MKKIDLTNELNAKITCWKVTDNVTTKYYDRKKYNTISKAFNQALKDFGNITFVVSGLTTHAETLPLNVNGNGTSFKVYNFEVDVKIEDTYTVKRISVFAETSKKAVEQIESYPGYSETLRVLYINSRIYWDLNEEKAFADGQKFIVY